MSKKPHKIMILDGIEYKLIPVHEKVTFTIDEIAEMTGISKHTIYKKMPILEKEKHYFKPNGGKLLFDESVVDFLIKQKGSSNDENIKRIGIHKNRQPVCLGDFLNK